MVCDGDPGFASPVRIVAANRIDYNHRYAKIWFDGIVELDALFDIDAGNGGESRLGGNTYVHIYDMQGNEIQFVQFHTSCSQPLIIGDQYGSLILEDFIPQ